MARCVTLNASPYPWHHGEGPFWDATTGRILCMDVLASEIVAIDASGGLSRARTPELVSWDLTDLKGDGVGKGGRQCSNSGQG
jgi:sugar lactone lactonase YvrE